jgi:periplasmic protein TonB
MEDEMFNNLIESSSHRGEFRRRGSFFLFTTASYALLFIIAGVVSIYAYDARMEDQSLELATIMPLVDLPIADTEREVTHEVTRPAHGERPQSDFIRRNPTASVSEPTLTPEGISSAPNPNPPIPPGGRFRIGTIDADPVQPGNTGPNTGGTTNNRAPVVVISEPPPAALPIAKPVPKVIRKSILNGEALVLPKPPYPPMAKQIGVRGTVNVQVLIDERGNVVSATPVSGHPLLVHAAKTAALQARFSPTMLGDQPVKVSGVITYNFVLQ